MGDIVWGWPLYSLVGGLILVFGFWIYLLTTSPPSDPGTF